MATNPLMLGFEAMEKTLERVAKSGDGYPPYNIERVRNADSSGDRLRITLAVAGFAECDLDISIEESQLTIRGKQAEDEPREEPPADPDGQALSACAWHHRQGRCGAQRRAG